MMSKVEATLMAFWLNVSNGFNAEPEFGPGKLNYLIFAEIFSLA